MVKNHTHHTFKPKYVLDYYVFKILNGNTILLITPNGKERKRNINDVRSCSTVQLVKMLGIHFSAI